MDTLKEKIHYLDALINKLEVCGNDADNDDADNEKMSIIRNVKAKLSEITARIGNSLKIYQVLPNIKIAHVEGYTTEIDDLINLLTDLQVSPKETSPPESNISLQHWYDKILYNIVKKQIAALSKCPMPMPKNLSYDAFNIFLFNELQMYTERLDMRDISTSTIIDIISDLDKKKISFMKDPFRSKLMHLLQILSCDRSLNLLPRDVIPIFQRCVYTVDFSEDEVEEIINQYDNMMQQQEQAEMPDNTHIAHDIYDRLTSQTAKIDDKDVDVLVIAMKHCPQKTMFVELCDILKIPHHVRDILFINILKSHKSPPNNIEVPSHYKHLFIE